MKMPKIMSGCNSWQEASGVFLAFQIAYVVYMTPLCTPHVNDFFIPLWCFRCQSIQQFRLMALDSLGNCV